MSLDGSRKHMYDMVC